MKNIFLILNNIYNKSITRKEKKKRSVLNGKNLLRFKKRITPISSYNLKQLFLLIFQSF